MFLSISFNESNSLAPEILILDQDRKTAIRHPRWVQFIALLAQRRLQSMENGLVALDELPSLLAYRNRTPDQIGKYLLNSAQTLPPLVTRFLRKHLRLTSIGPFFLEIMPEGIITDITRLDHYISWIYANAGYKKSTRELLWNDVRQAIDYLEACQSRYLISRSFLNKEIEENDSPLACSSALTNIVRAGIIRNGATRNQSTLIALAKSHAPKTNDGAMKILLLANAYNTELWISPLTKRNLPTLLALNQTTIDLAERLPKTSMDRHCLLASRYYYIAYASLFFGAEEYVSANLKKSRDLFEMISKEGPPRIIPYDPGVVDSADLQVELLRRVNLRQTPNNEDIARYNEAAGNRSLIKLTTLSFAEWITEGYIRQNQDDKAFTFATEALIDHACMFDSSIFRRLNTVRKKLAMKSKID
jgi:hypothetical protein